MRGRKKNKRTGQKAEFTGLLEQDENLYGWRLPVWNHVGGI
jgi:hypothetical protein